MSSKWKGDRMLELLCVVIRVRLLQIENIWLRLKFRWVMGYSYKEERG